MGMFFCAVSYDGDDGALVKFKPTTTIAYEILEGKFMEKPSTQQYVR